MIKKIHDAFAVAIRKNSNNVGKNLLPGMLSG